MTETETETETVTEIETEIETVTRAKGGRPMGSTNERKRNIELAVIAAKNEVATRAHKLMRTYEKGKIMAKGSLAIIV